MIDLAPLFTLMDAALRDFEQSGTACTKYRLETRRATELHESMQAMDAAKVRAEAAIDSALSAGAHPGLDAGRTAIGASYTYGMVRVTDAATAMHTLTARMFVREGVIVPAGFRLGAASWHSIAAAAEALAITARLFADAAEHAPDTADADGISITAPHAIAVEE